MTRHDWAEWVGDLEQRSYSRVRCDIKTRCRLLDSAAPGPLEGRTCDMSGSGLQLRFPANLQVEPGQSLELAFRNDADEFNLAIGGVVVWRRWNEKTSDFSVGVQFPALASAVREALLAVLGRSNPNLEEGDPELLRLKRYLSTGLRRTGRLFARNVTGLVRDIGLGGMGVEAEKRYKTDSMFAASIYIETEAEPVSILARALRVSDAPVRGRWLMGMRFEAMGEKARSALRCFVSDEIKRSILG